MSHLLEVLLYQKGPVRSDAMQMIWDYVPSATFKNVQRIDPLAILAPWWLVLYEGETITKGLASSLPALIAAKNHDAYCFYTRPEGVLEPITCEMRMFSSQVKFDGPQKPDDIVPTSIVVAERILNGWILRS